jgi:hypothetical protein
MQLYEKAKRAFENQLTTDSTLVTSGIKQQLDSLQDLLNIEELHIIKNYPELFISKLIAAQREIEIPQSIFNDTLQRFLYQKAFFWDRLDLSDERFLRTPLLNKMINTYFDHFVLLHPDSTIAAIDTVIQKARPSREVVSYLLWYFTSEYQNPTYMGFDKVFVHLVDNYFLKEVVTNAGPSVLEKLKERSDKLKPLLIGETAPNLILIDTNDRFKSFSNLETDYTILLFWDYNCDVCITEIEELLLTLDATNYEIGVYAVNTNGNIDKWKQVIRDKEMDWFHVNGTRGVTKDYHDLYDINGTPRLFLLDHEKKIIAKHFKVAQLIAIIENQFMKSK